MISDELLRMIHEAASIERWNDHMRPSQGFFELDKQAHKMIIAYIIGKFEEESSPFDWIKLIEGGIYEFLHRIVFTDIKPPIFHRLLKENGEKLNKWAYEQILFRLNNKQYRFLDNYQNYFFDESYAVKEKMILRAAHYLATNWEFKHIYELNRNFYGIEDTKKEIEGEIENYYSLDAIKEMLSIKRIQHFIDLAGQLRFQKRWTNTPRIPPTSVLGHMLIVAILSYICSLEIKGCPKRKYNNFFAALFHDLPEVLTRDIISPVKRSIHGLEDIIKEIENSQMAEKIYPLLPESWHEEISYFIENEFSSKIRYRNFIKNISSEEITVLYNDDKYSPIDGKIIKACDRLAAYYEAKLSIEHGVFSRNLEEGLNAAKEKYQKDFVAGIDFSLFYK